MELTLKPIIFWYHLAIRKRHVSVQAPPRPVLALSEVRRVLLAVDAKSTLHDIVILFLAALLRSILFILLNLRQLLRCREVAPVNDVGLRHLLNALRQRHVLRVVLGAGVRT